MVGPPLVLYAAITGNADLLYYIATRLARLGVLLVGVRLRFAACEHLQAGPQLHLHVEPRFQS